MTTTQLQRKILDLEKEVVLLRSTLQSDPDFTVDEKNWADVKPTVKVIRKKLYRERYGKT